MTPAFLRFLMIAILRLELEQEYKLSPTSPLYLRATLSTNITRKDTRSIRRVIKSLITSSNGIHLFIGVVIKDVEEVGDHDYSEE